MRLISWNLQQTTGATAQDVARLVRLYSPDLLLLQEVTVAINILPELIGGSWFRRAMLRRVHGLGIWSPHALPQPLVLDLPVTGRPPIQRYALVLGLPGLQVGNIHCTHGQRGLRQQVRHVMDHLDGPAVLMGDFNALGPVATRGFRDIGPLAVTHFAGGLLPVRPDRCLGRGVTRRHAEALAFGPSDHRPLLVDLSGPDPFAACAAETRESVSLTP